MSTFRSARPASPRRPAVTPAQERPPTTHRISRFCVGPTDLVSWSPVSIVAQRLLLLFVTVALVGGGRPDPAVGAPLPEPSQTVNPAWQAMNARAFAAPPAGDVQTVIPTAGRNTDDGIVVVRFFIPACDAAGGILKGDCRGFDANPAASSRAVLAWDTETGRVSFRVDHSTTRRGNPDAALPLRSLDRKAVWDERDVRRTDNRVWVSAAPNRVDARLSIVNSTTNQWRFGAWSVDNDLTVFRGARGGYTLQINGNGYPAVEVYYYPHYGAGSPHRIAFRDVQFFYLNQPQDLGGGSAALDRFSWSDCVQRSRSLFCNSARGPWGARVPESALDWTTRW